MNRVFMLPASNYQSKLYDFLKIKKCEVFTINPVESYISKDNQKNHLYCDVFDIDKIFNFLKEKKIEFGVTDQSDISVVPFNKICKRLNLKCNSFDSIVKFSCDKKQMYDFAFSIGISHLGSNFVNEFSDIKNKLPVVIKPIDSTNSRGVYKIESEEDFNNFFINSLGFSRSKKVIYQKFISECKQITVEGICINNKHINLTSSLKGPYWDTSVTSWLKYPLSNFIEKDILNKVYEKNNLFVESSGLDFGLTHAEYILKDNEIYLNEIACRGGGFKIASDVVPYVCGFSPYECIFNYLKNEPCTVPQVVKEKFVTIKFYKKLNLEKNTVDLISNTKSVIDFGYDFSKNEYAKNKTNPRHSYLILKAESENLLAEEVKKVENIIYGNSSFCSDVQPKI